MLIPTTAPTSVTAGDTIKFQISLTDYPASDGWTLAYTLFGISGPPITWTGTASGAFHLVSIPAATTAAYAPGSYTATRSVSKGAERYTLGSAPVAITANPATMSTGFDNRSAARKVVDAIDALMLGTASTGQQEMNIDGTMLKNYPVADLLKIRSVYLFQVSNEESAQRLANGKSPRRKVLTRFV